MLSNSDFRETDCWITTFELRGDEEDGLTWTKYCRTMAADPATMGVAMEVPAIPSISQLSSPSGFA